MTTTTRPVTLEAYFESQAQYLTDRCTRCGKCVEVCPIVHTEYTPLKDAEPVGVITGVVEFLRGKALSKEAENWTELCMGSGECITHCPEHINPRLMLAIALTRIRAQKSERGENPQDGFYKRMSQIIKLATGLQMSPEQYRRVTGSGGNKAQADLVMYLGCNVLRTPVIVFSVMDILDRLGVDYAMLGGVANCCGLVHLKLHGDVESTDVIASGTIDKLAAFGARKVLHWCPSCVMQFGETLKGLRPHSFEFEHFSEYLANKLTTLREMFVQPIRRRVALHHHDGGMGIHQNVGRLLAAIPGLEVVPIEEHHNWAYSCGPGALGNVQAAREASHRQTLEAAVTAGADMLVTLYHTCHRDLCAFEGQYPLEVKNWTSLVAVAMGLPEHEDRYKRYKLYNDINAILEDGKEFLQAHKLDVSAIREVLPGLLVGKERGLSVW